LRLLERGTRREQVVAQRATLEGLEASLATRTVELRQTVLRAPFAGKVGLVHADPGTVVSAGSPVMTLIESKALEAWVGVPPGPARALTVGSQQVVLIEGRPVRALVRAQLPELDPATRTSTVILTLEDSAGLLPEQIVRLVLPRRLPATGYWVPLTALSHGERAVWSLLVVVSSKDEATVERRLIEVLHTDPGRALVRGDLRAGEAYVSTGVHRVVPGQRVAPRAAQ
ncbi:MAG: efflux RND transporter periplasmic adaptor subunit, partial [Planctomycetes bacterium]|nr:efflux RND transporter periplasmic adaptor subunit [Planctomycetota bacterium]